MRRRRLIAVLAVLVVAALFGGRWVALETAERAWAQTVEHGGVYVEARDLARLVRGVVLLAGALWGVVQFYLVYRAIGSVQVPRRLGNIEIVEAVPQRLLLALALGTGLAYGLLLTLGTGDWWLAAALAAESPRFGTADPILERDLGFYLGPLAWSMTLQNRALVAALSAAVLVGLLYFGMGALRFERGRPVAGPHVRAHLGTLLATLALVLGWGALLDPAEVVAGAHGPLDHAALTVRLPGSAAVVGATLVVAGLSLAWAWRGRPAALPAAWGLLLITQITVYLLAPALVRAGRGPAGASDPALAEERAALERVARGADAFREEPLPEFPSPRAAIAALPLWDADQVARAARYRRVFGDRATAVATALLPGGRRRPAWLAVPAPDLAAFERLVPRPAWEEIHAGSWARTGAPLVAVEEDSGLAFEPAPVRDSAFWFGPGLPEFAIAAPDTWPGLRPAGMTLDGWWRRIALAWALQSPELLGLPQDRLVLWRQEPGERLARLLPAARFDAPVPVIADGALLWTAYGYVESSLFPMVGSVEGDTPAGRGTRGGQRRGRGGARGDLRYVRVGFVGTVNAATGETRIHLAPGHDSLSAAWARVFAPLVRPVEELPGQLANVLPFPRRAFGVAAEDAVRDRADTVTWQRRPVEPFTAPAPGAGLWLAQGFETVRPPAFVALVAGRMTASGPRLALWRPSPPEPRPVPVVGSPELRPGPLRLWPAGGALLAVQGQFGEAAQPGRDPAPPKVTRVYLSWGARGGSGPTAEAAMGDLFATGPTRDTTLAARWAEARRLLARADSALARGDLQEFGRLYQALRRLLAPPREPR